MIILHALSVGPSGNLLLPQGREIDPTDGVKEHEKNILCRHDRLFGFFLEVAVGREKADVSSRCQGAFKEV